MEPTKVASSQGAQPAHAARAKSSSHPATAEAGDPAAGGGFLALLAALGDGVDGNSLGAALVTPPCLLRKTTWMHPHRRLRTQLPWPHGNACLIPRKTRRRLVRSMDSLRWWHLNLLTRSRGASLRYRSPALKDWRFPQVMGSTELKDLYLFRAIRSMICCWAGFPRAWLQRLRNWTRLQT